MSETCQNPNYVMSISDTHGTAFLRGLGAALITIGITFPVTKIVIRQILFKVSGYTAVQQLHREGLHYLFRGVLPPAIQRCISLSMMFGISTEVVTFLKEAPLNNNTKKAIGAFTAGTVESLFVPLERLQILLIDSRHHQRFKNMLEALRFITRQYGIREFYRGYTVLLFRNTMSNSIFFVSRDNLHDKIQTSQVVYVNANMANFLSGAALGACMSIVLYPVKVVKVSILKRLGGPFESPFRVIRKIYQQNNGRLLDFYRGAVMNCGKAIITWGVTNSAYEYLKIII